MSSIIYFIASFLGHNSPALPTVTQPHPIDRCAALMKTHDRAPFEKAILPCFEKESAPFSVAIEAQLIEGSYRLSELENFNIFFEGKMKSCLTKSLRTIPKLPERAYLKEYVLGIRVDLSRLEGKSLSLKSATQCAEPREKLYTEDAKPSRDMIYPVGAPMEKDDHYRGLFACERFLDGKMKLKRQMGPLTIDYEVKDKKLYFKKLNLSVEEAPAGYTECIAAELTRDQDQLSGFMGGSIKIGDEEIMKDGVKSINRVFFARVPNRRRVFYYLLHRPD